MFRKYNRSSQQLVAHCFFSHGMVKYEDYSKYYESKQQEDS